MIEIFLSLQDPRELPKGSRDPLGYEVIWTRYGRKVVSNLTTITGSIEEFLTALLGFELSWTTDSDEQKNRFIRYEQVAGYLREYANRLEPQRKPGGFVRGVTRVAKRLEELEARDNGFITVSKDGRDMILSSQAAYGLWGLYSTALEISGLIEARKVTPKGKEIVESMMRGDAGLMEFLNGFVENEVSQLSLQEVREYADRFVALLQGGAQRMLLEVLLRGDEKSLQPELFDFLESLDEAGYEELGGDVWKLVEACRQAGGRLGRALDDIERLDRTLWLSSAFFDYLRLPQWSGKGLSEAIEELKKGASERAVGLLELPADLTIPELTAFRRAWNEGAWMEAAKRLLKRHADIMSQREGAPWVEVESGGKLKIRVEAPNATFDPSKPGHIYDYFLGAYLRIYEAYRKGRR